MLWKIETPIFGRFEGLMASFRHFRICVGASRFGAELGSFLRDGGG
jgi:hypothetical protein